jgi:hypothetical protein
LSLPPQSAASFISNQVSNVAYWHLADIRSAATSCPLLEQQRTSFVQSKVQIFLLAADFAAQRVEIKP